MTAANGSSVFDAWRFLLRICSDASYPPPMIGTDFVAVWLGDPKAPPGNIGEAFERVVVVPISRNNDEEWGPMGRFAHKERFRVPVYAETNLPGLTALQAVDRLEEICDTITLAIRDTIEQNRNNGTPPVEFVKYPVAVYLAGPVAPVVAPLSSGYVGAADLFVDFEMRVGTPPNPE